MAFQQAIPRPTRRVVQPAQAAAPAHKEPESVRLSQEWIHFSSDPQHTTSDSLRTPHTAACPGFSDVGSLQSTSGPAQARNNEDKCAEELPEDLDSLDDGLNAFSERVSHQTNQALASSAEPVLPTHDGLGLFVGNSSPVQAQIWQHEQYNPERRSYGVRHKSLQHHLDLLEGEDQHQSTLQDERYDRIQAWRLDHSKAILDEIEAQSRRERRRSRLETNDGSLHQSDAAQNWRFPVADCVDTDRSRQTVTELENESFWTRFTRCVIRDLMGIDEDTLSYIFGESLPTDTVDSQKQCLNERSSNVALTSVEEHVGLIVRADSWEERLVSRIARELGSLVHRISEHPGAFSTFLKTQEQPQYAGLPTPASFVRETYPQYTRAPVRKLRKHRRRASAVTIESSLSGIEEEVEDVNEEHSSQDRERGHQSLNHEREYWERDLDVMMVFGFFRNRLSGSPQQSLEPTSRSDSMAKVSASSREVIKSRQNSSLRRAALIRHHHPLVSNLTSHSRPVLASTLPPSPILGRRQNSLVDGDELSSCASQSTKKSKMYHSGSLSLGSSRNYWDIGGPGWGEV